MSRTAVKIARDNRAVVIYQRTDARGRQELEARNARGRVLFKCRRIRALASWIRNKDYNFYEYSSLPSAARRVLDNFRAGVEHARTFEQPKAPKLGDVWPE